MAEAASPTGEVRAAHAAHRAVTAILADIAKDWFNNPAAPHYRGIHYNDKNYIKAAAALSEVRGK